MKAAMRAVKNSVMNYDDAEIRVREATSNEAWGASSALMLQIAEDTHHRYRYKSTLEMINKRLVDYQHMNHVLKTLMLIEFLLRHGDMRFVQDMQDRKLVIRRLRGYKYYKDQKEIGGNVRKWANKIMQLLENGEELKKERESAQKTRGKIHGYSNDSAPAERRAAEPKKDFALDFQPDPSSPKQEEEEEEESPKPKPKAKGAKAAKEQPKKTADDDFEAEEFDPDAFAAESKPKTGKKQAPSSNSKSNKQAPAAKKPAKAAEPEEDEEEEDEEDENTKGGEVQFDEAAEGDDFAFAFEDDPKNAKAAPQKGGAAAAKGGKGKAAAAAAADPDEFLFAIAPAAQKPAAAPAVALPNVEDDAEALFDFGGASSAKKAASPPSNTDDTEATWDQLTNVNLREDPKQKKKPAAKKGGPTLNQIGGGNELVAIDFGAAVNGGQVVPAANPFAMGPDPMNPFAVPAGNPYAGAGNPYPAAANPWGAPAPAGFNPYPQAGYNPYPQAAAPMADPFGNPFGAPAAGPYANYVAPAAAPAARPNPAAAAKPAAKPADPFGDFQW